MKRISECEGIRAYDKELLAQVKKTIEGFLPRAEILLYGSVAKGHHDAESDYDILVLTDSPLSRQEQAAIRDTLFELELATGAVLSVIFSSREEWNQPPRAGSPSRQNGERDGILL